MLPIIVNARGYKYPDSSLRWYRTLYDHWISSAKKEILPSTEIGARKLASSVSAIEIQAFAHPRIAICIPRAARVGSYDRNHWADHACYLDWTDHWHCRTMGTRILLAPCTDKLTRHRGNHPDRTSARDWTQRIRIQKNESCAAKTLPVLPASMIYGSYIWRNGRSFILFGKEEPSDEENWFYPRHGNLFLPAFAYFPVSGPTSHLYPKLAVKNNFMKYSDTDSKCESPEICIRNQAPFRLLQLASFAVYISMLLIIVGIMFVPYGKSRPTSYFRHDSFMPSCKD